MTSHRARYKIYKGLSKTKADIDTWEKNIKALYPLTAMMQLHGLLLLEANNILSVLIYSHFDIFSPPAPPKKLITCKNV